MTDNGALKGMKGLIIRMSEHAVWKASLQNPSIHLDDLIREGQVTLFESLPHFDPTKGKLTTFLWHRLRHTTKRFITDVVKTELHTFSIYEDPDNPLEFPDSENQLKLQELLGELNQLSQLAKQIVLLALRSDFSVKEIREYFLFEGFKSYIIDQEIHEIRLVLRAMVPTFPTRRDL